MPQKFSQGRLALHIWFAAQIVTVEHQKIEGAGRSALIFDPTMQGIENRHSIRVQPNHFSIEDNRAIDLAGGLDDQRVAFRPVRTVDRIETHPSIADADLQSVAVMLQLMRPAWPGWGLLGDDWLTRMNESGGRV
jgi:hypothetical protein